MSDAFRIRLQAALGGAYILERELVGGGMSRVFVGTETTLGRIVVKVLPAERATPDPIERFKREAELGARLEHPHIVPVYDVGEVDDIRYFTMPFIDGETLRHRLHRTGAMPAAEASRVLREIGSALTYAHGRGVVHRDVKPENIFIEHASGRALLADFGVALAVGVRSDLPQPGATVGTPAYMSPEQVDGSDIDGRSDVYSLGLVGWEMLTGDRPWSDRYDSAYDVMHKQKHQLLPSLADLGIVAPRELVETIERALLKDRRVRWATAAAFVGGLGSGASDPESAIRTQKLQGAGARGQGPELQRSEARGQRPEERGGELQRGEERGAEFEREATPVEQVDAPTTRARATRDDRLLWDEELAAVWGSEKRESRRSLYAAAAVVLVAGAAIVGAAMVWQPTLVQQLTTAGPVAEPLQTAAAPADASGAPVDTVSAGEVAAKLTPMERTRAAVARMPKGVLVKAAPMRPANQPERTVSYRPGAAEAHRRPSSPSDPVRARIATALVSLKEYERVQAEMAKAGGGVSSAPAASVPAAPARPH
jgi:hypothetical protein